MNESMNLIKTCLLKILEGIDNGTIYATDKQIDRAAKFLGHIFSPTMTRQEVLEELGICDTTLRKKIKNGSLPRGSKIRGLTTHKWNKAELESTKFAQTRVLT